MPRNPAPAQKWSRWIAGIIQALMFNPEWTRAARPPVCHINFLTADRVTDFDSRHKPSAQAITQCHHIERLARTQTVAGARVKVISAPLLEKEVLRFSHGQEGLPCIPNR